MEKSERDNMKLEIVLAGLQVPEYPTNDTVQENLDLLLALRKKG